MITINVTIYKHLLHTCICMKKSEKDLRKVARYEHEQPAGKIEYRRNGKPAGLCSSQV